MQKYIQMFVCFFVGLLITFIILYNAFLNAEYTTREYTDVTILQVKLLNNNFIFELY